MTANVRKMIRSRAGNGVPAPVVSGSASAMTSESPPRMPAQPVKAMRRQGGYSHFTPSLRSTNRGR